MLEHLVTQKIQERTATIAILGLGYVGLPLATLFVKAGFNIIGYDIDSGYIERLRDGESRIIDISSAELKLVLQTNRFYPTNHAEELKRADVYIICVPTPLSKTRQPDLSFIEQAVQTLYGIWESHKLVVLESTTYPGTTDEVLLPHFSRNGFQIDHDFLLAFSPERVDPGNANYPLRTIPKVVGGVTPASGRVTGVLYATIFDTVHLASTARIAELTKLLENVFRNVNIALVNEFAQICDTLQVNVWEVIEAAKTKPFGFMAFNPGPGIGGHCIPLDPQYLVYKSRLSGYEPQLVALADRINQERPAYIVQQVIELLNQQEKALKGSKILVLGVAYKPDVPDVRESPALTIIQQLLDRGGQVSYSDPFVPFLKVENGEILESVSLSEGTLEEVNAGVIVTSHRVFDYNLIAQYAFKVLDTRNILSTYLMPNQQRELDRSSILAKLR